MTSSGASIVSAPPHPEAAGNEAEAGDGRQPQVECFAYPEVPADHERGEAEPDRREGRAEPQASQGVAKQEQRRPERHLLARPEASDEVRPDPPESVEEGEGGKNAQPKAAGGRCAIAQQGERADDADEVDEEPARAEPFGIERDHEVAREIYEAPQDDDERGVAIDARLLDLGDDALDVGERRSGFVGANGHAGLAGKAPAGSSGFGKSPRRRQRKKSRRPCVALTAIISPRLIAPTTDLSAIAWSRGRVQTIQT